MITLNAPARSAPLRAIKLSTGSTVFPRDRQVRVLDEDEAQELEREGWTRDAASRQAKAVDTDLLRKGMSCQLTRNSPGVGSPIVDKRRMPSDSELLRKGLSAQLAREPHSIGDPDPDRKRELGEIEINIGTDQRRIRVSHDPGEGTLNLHGVMVRTSDIDADLMRSFEATAATFNALQGHAEQATQRILIGALLDRIMRRHKFVADAVTRQIDRERIAV